MKKWILLIFILLGLACIVANMIGWGTTATVIKMQDQYISNLLTATPVGELYFQPTREFEGADQGKTCFYAHAWIWTTNIRVPDPNKSGGVKEAKLCADSPAGKNETIAVGLAYEQHLWGNGALMLDKKVLIQIIGMRPVRMKTNANGALIAAWEEGNTVNVNDDIKAVDLNQVMVPGPDFLIYCKVRESIAAEPIGCMDFGLKPRMTIFRANPAPEQLGHNYYVIKAYDHGIELAPLSADDMKFRP